MTCHLCNDTGEQRYWEGRWRDERASNAELLEALTKLTNEITGLVAGYECELRAGVGNTNFAVMQQRVSEARAALAKARGEA